MPPKKSGHVTLLDVSQASGFSVSTVSLVLSEAPLSQSISAATQERIRAKASELGYHPNAYARSLRVRKTQTVGVLAFDLSDEFCIPIMRGIHAGLHSANYPPLVMDAQTEHKLFDSNLNLLLQRRVEGVIVIASWVFEETPLLADMQKNRVPTIIVGRDLASRGLTSILVDNELGGALAMRHLVALGHKKIAVILGPKEMWDSQPRWQGIQRVAAEHDIRLDKQLIARLPSLTDATSGFDGGRELVKSMLKTKLPFTAVLAFDDLTALGVVRGLIESGRKVPNDCSVMGFDDVLPARVATPAISTVRQPLYDMGKQAAELMLQALKEDSAMDRAAQLVKATPELVVRSSTISVT